MYLFWPAYPVKMRKPTSTNEWLFFNLQLYFITKTICTLALFHHPVISRVVSSFDHHFLISLWLERILTDHAASSKICGYFSLKQQVFIDKSHIIPFREDLLAEI